MEGSTLAASRALRFWSRRVAESWHLRGRYFGSPRPPARIPHSREIMFQLLIWQLRDFSSGNSEWRRAKVSRRRIPPARLTPHVLPIWPPRKVASHVSRLASCISCLPSPSRVSARVVSRASCCTGALSASTRVSHTTEKCVQRPGHRSAPGCSIFFYVSGSGCCDARRPPRLHRKA